MSNKMIDNLSGAPLTRATVYLFGGAVSRRVGTGFTVNSILESSVLLVLKKSYILGLESALLPTFV